jgi:selenium-binding protein 1
LHKVVEPEDIQQQTGLSYLHTSHCLGSGDILISAMGDPQGEAKGGYLLLTQDFQIKGHWEASEEAAPKFGYDMWYQPYHNVMVSSEVCLLSTLLSYVFFKRFYSLCLCSLL